MSRFLIVALALLAACSPSSLDEYRQEGEARSRRLINELQKIHYRDDLQAAAPRLKNHFEALVDLIIDSRRYQKKHPVEQLEFSFADDWNTSDELRAELLRVYRIEGGRETIEKAQREALLRLDAYNKGLSERKSSRGK